MKLLKIFESKYYDEFEKVKQISDADNLELDIKDLIQDLQDEIDFEFFKSKHTVLLLNYQRKVKRQSVIGLDYYQKIIDSGHRISAAEGYYIKDFIDKLSYGESLYFYKLFNFQIETSEPKKLSKSDLTKLSKFKETFEPLLKRLESLGYQCSVSYDVCIPKADIQNIISGKYLSGNMSFPTGIESLNNIISRMQNDISEELDDKFGDYLKISPLSYQMYLSIVYKIDFDKPKVDISEIPKHLSTSFEDFIKKYRIPKVGQEELKQILKIQPDILKESVEIKDEFDEVKLTVKDWFDSYTDDIVEVTNGRLYMRPLHSLKCPRCRPSIYSDYELPVPLPIITVGGNNNYQCPNCNIIGTSHDFGSGVELNMIYHSVWGKDFINSITVRDLETGNFLLHRINDDQVEHLNSIIKPLGYSYFRWGTKKNNIVTICNSTITSLQNVEDIKKNITNIDNVQILYPKII